MKNRLAAALLALLLFTFTSLAAAQIGEPTQDLVAQLEEYAPKSSPDRLSFTAASDFTYSIRSGNGVTLAVSGSGVLNDANVRFLGALIGAASGYGEGIAGPVADFFRSQAAELAGSGEVALEVMEYLMYVEVAAEEPRTVQVRFEPQRISADRFAAGAHSLGPADARYVVREFTDFQCPFCAVFAAEGLALIESELLPRGDVRFELHHFPLKSIHPNAVVAAEASECVALEAAEASPQAGEDAFWAFQQALFEEQQAWSDLPDPVNTFVAMAGELGLPNAELATCLRSGRVGEAIEASYKTASQDLHITGTPTVFLNGFKVNDYRDLESYLKLMRLSDALEVEDAAQ